MVVLASLQQFPNHLLPSLLSLLQPDDQVVPGLDQVISKGMILYKAFHLWTFISLYYVNISSTRHEPTVKKSDQGNSRTGPSTSAASSSGGMVPFEFSQIEILCYFFARR